MNILNCSECVHVSPIEANQNEIHETVPVVVATAAAAPSHYKEIKYATKYLYILL